GSVDPSSAATTDATLDAPGTLRLSTHALDLGHSGTAGTVRLSNVGGSPVAYTARARADWLALSTAGATIAADGSDGLRITARRSGLPEGTHRGRVTVTWPGRTETVTVTLRVDRAPVIGPIAADATSCSIPVSATVSDGT